MTDKNNGTSKSFIDSLIKVVLGAVATLLICGFANLEAKKLDKEVFNLYKEYRAKFPVHPLPNQNSDISIRVIVF